MKFAPLCPAEDHIMTREKRKCSQGIRTYTGGIKEAGFARSHKGALAWFGGILHNGWLVGLPKRVA